MPEQEKTNRTVDRRAFLKILGAAGATAVVVSACQPQALGQTPVVPTAVPATAVPPTAVPPTKVPPTAVPAAVPITGAGKPVLLATVGPGNNPAYEPVDDLKFLPPEKIPEGTAATLFASLDKAKLLTAYQRMVTSRKWETTFKDLFLAGKDALTGAFHMYIGEEAIANGVMTALNADDWIASTHRGHGHLHAKGGDLNKMSAEIFFKSTGYGQGFSGSMHLTDVSKGILGMNGIVGASWYIAAGAAYGAMVKKTKQVAVAFGGDGAANSAYFFSAVRNATMMKIPVIFVIENNFQQQGIAMATVTPTKTLADYTKGLDIPCLTIDGNDIASVYATMKAAADRARSGAGPTVIECWTFRWYDHSGTAGAKVGVDGAFGLPYRSDDAVRAWMGRDPIARYKTFLLDKSLATAAELSKIETDAQAAVDASVEFARSSPLPKPQDGLKYAYATGTVAPTQFFGAVAPA